MPRLGSTPIPCRRRGVVFRHALPFTVERRKIELRIGVAMFGGAS